jgi:3-isopropylmalate dehydrogenase
MSTYPVSETRTCRVAVLPGDGIGPEVTAEALRVLDAVSARLPELRIVTREFSVGAGAYLRQGEALRESDFEEMRGYDAILLGAMGLPEIRTAQGTEIAPQLDLRERLDLYCGVRPLYLFHASHSPLKGYASGGIDFAIVRENTEGLFSSRKQRVTPGATVVEDTLRVSRSSSEKLFHAAFRLARRRRAKVTLVDKANVLPSMAFFRGVFDEVSGAYPEVTAEKLYVDAAALLLVQRPASFDVVVTENMFGDILSDLGAALVGGMGMAPSGDIGDRWAVFQPSHGSAPDIAGKGIANPVATILSAAMMLDWLGGAACSRGAALIHDAIRTVLAGGAATRDLGGTLSTSEMGQAVAQAVEAQA